MELKTSTIGSEGHEVLLEDFVSHGITVPKGFEFDGASAPRPLYFIIPPYKKTKKAACVHDWNCRNARDREERLIADRLFYKMLTEGGINKVRASLGYIGVRIGYYLGIGVYYG